MNMTVSLLYVDGCPNWRVADERLREALAAVGRAATEVEYVQVSTPQEAEAISFHGSPTVLVDGLDPFADAHTPVGLACRLYRTESGLAGSPTVAQLVAVLRSPSESLMTVDHAVLDAQRRHWQEVFRANQAMYGTNPSSPALQTLELFAHEHCHDVLELGAGQGRDTLAFLRAGLSVTALEYAPGALTELTRTATDAGLTERLTALVHDARQRLPLPDESVDGVYSHMLFNMALTTSELESLAREVHRVLRRGGWHVYTVRHTGDAHHGTGIPRGDNMTEHGGFIVHFFDQPLVDRLAEGFSSAQVIPFEEGDLPRRLWRVTQQKVTGPLRS